MENNYFFTIVPARAIKNDDINEKTSYILLSFYIFYFHFISWKFFFLKIKLLLAIRKLDTELPIITRR